MLLEDFRSLCDRFEEVKNKLKEKQKMLSELEEKHNDFWLELKGQCLEKGHDFRQNDPSFIKCPHCLHFVKTKLGPLCSALRVRVKDPSIYDESTFEKWMEEDHKGWLIETITFEETKKEVQDFFCKSKQLKSQINVLEKELKEINKTLEEIWEVADKILEKDLERMKTRNEYELTIRDLKGLRRED